MNRAFVLEKETILCCQTLAGWQPILIKLPNDSEEEQSPYQLGRVKLSVSLASNCWQANDEDNNSDFETDQLTLIAASASHAISCDYAQQNQLELPVIIADMRSGLVASITADTLSDVDTNKSSKAEVINAFISYRQLLTQLSSMLADQLSQAIQLLRWQADTQFCSRCSAPVSAAKSGERSMVCPVCRLHQYPRVQPCVITAITRTNPQTAELQILMAHHHRYGQTSLPLQYGLIAGFVEVGESLEQAVVREVAEEVGISLTDICYISSQPWPFPSNLMLGFQANYASGDIVLQEDELSHAEFFDLSALPKIPFKGSIAYELIARIAHQQGVSLD